MICAAVVCTLTKNTANTEESASSAEGLNSQANELANLISKFKTN